MAEEWKHICFITSKATGLSQFQLSFLGGGSLGQLHDLHKQLWKEKSTSLLHMNLCNFPDVTALFDAQNAHVIGKVQVLISH